MRIYLDVCCLNRPFDDQSQTRVRDETLAVQAILDAVDRGLHDLVGSQMMRIELKAIRDVVRRRKVRALLPAKLLALDDAVHRRARELMVQGFRAADAVHVAAAERIAADVLVTTDDRLARRGKRLAKRLRVRVADVLSFVEELQG